MMEKIGKLIIEKYLPLEISQLEFAAMIGIQLWNSGRKWNGNDLERSLKLLKYF